MVLTLALAVTCALSCVTSGDGDNADFARKTIRVGEREFGYRLLEPSKVEEGKSYPLILFLHGAGERGSDNEKQLAYLPRTMAGLRDRYPCYVVALQCPGNEKWSAVRWSDTSSQAQTPRPTDPLLAAVRAMEATITQYPVDIDRVYLTGLSMGGYGSWDLAMRYPDVFAAVVPICGGGDEKRVHRMAAIPTAVYHGDADKVVPVKRSRTLVERLLKLGSSPNYFELPGVGHNAWALAYKTDKAIGWMFEQRRTQNPVSGIQVLVGSASPLRKEERIVFFGDSITQAATRPGGYIHLIDTAVQERKADLSIQLIGAGISGHKVPDLQKRLDRDVLAKKPTVVFIYIGINDVWHSQSGRGTSKEAFEAGLRDLVTRMAASKSKPRVILATPTVIGEKARGSNPLDAMLDEYAEISRKVAADMKLHLCDLRKSSIDYLSIRNRKGKSKGLLTTDGVHLNAEGNRFLANHAALSIFEVLSR